jgi:hypothetical protein
MLLVKFIVWYLILLLIKSVFVKDISTGSWKELPGLALALFYLLGGLVFFTYQIFFI